jgi:hypothetical protein
MVALDLVAPDECLAEKDDIGCLVGEQRGLRTRVSRVPRSAKLIEESLHHTLQCIAHPYFSQLGRDGCSA